MRKIKAKAIVPGQVIGELVIIRHPISFLGEFDPREGTVLSENKKIMVKNKIVFIPSIRGSTVGSYVLYAAKENKSAPNGIITLKPDPILITGAVISDIPLFQIIESIDIESISIYNYALLDPIEEIITLSKK